MLAKHPGTPTRRAGNASEAFRDPKRKGPLTSRRSTCGFFAIPGRAFHAALAPRDQPAPGGGSVMTPRRCPGPPECEVTSLARGSRASLAHRPDATAVEHRRNPWPERTHAGPRHGRGILVPVLLVLRE